MNPFKRLLLWSTLVWTALHVGLLFWASWTRPEGLYSVLLPSAWAMSGWVIIKSGGGSLVRRAAARLRKTNTKDAFRFLLLFCDQDGRQDFLLACRDLEEDLSEMRLAGVGLGKIRLTILYFRTLRPILLGSWMRFIRRFFRFGKAPKKLR